jgi:hypothetical protein
MIKYKTILGGKPKEYNSPMDKNDHPELNTTTKLQVNATKDAP